MFFVFFWFLYFRFSESDRASKSAALNIINIKFSRVDLTANDRLLKKQSQPREKKRVSVKFLGGLFMNFLHF